MKPFHESTPSLLNRRIRAGAPIGKCIFSGPGISEFISGGILQHETIRQGSSDGTPFPEFRATRGILPGIKVDGGPKRFAGWPSELVTEGLDGLRDRLSEYRAMGARFAKWRAAIHITDALPSTGCVIANANALSRYATLSQEQGLVPIVEPEVLMDGRADDPPHRRDWSED